MELSGILTVQALCVSSCLSLLTSFISSKFQTRFFPYKLSYYAWATCVATLKQWTLLVAILLFVNRLHECEYLIMLRHWSYTSSPMLKSMTYLFIFIAYNAIRNSTL